MNKVAPVYRSQAFKLAKNHFIHTAEQLNFFRAVFGSGEQWDRPSGHRRIRMGVKGEYGRDSVNFPCTLHCPLHQGAVAQMYAVKITQRNGTGT